MSASGSTDDGRAVGSTLDGLAYRLLKTLSHAENLKTHELMSRIAEAAVHDATDARSFLRHVGKHLILDLNDKSIIDIGCGKGDLVIAAAKSGARKAVGVDIDQELIDTARRNVIAERVDEIATFECLDFAGAYNPHGLFDYAFSQNGFEHILAPMPCLEKARGCLTTGGVFATMFGPLWCSPYGAHTRGFTPVPWVHFLFPEKVVLRVRTERYRPDDPVERYEDVRGHLNRMTVKRFKRYVAQAGFALEVLRSNPPQDRGIYRLANGVVNAVPLLQELGSLQLLAVLSKTD